MPWHVVAIRAPAGREAFRASAAVAAGPLTVLLRDRRAKAVFPEKASTRPTVARVPAATRSAMVREAADDMPPLPDAFVVKARSDAEAGVLLARLQDDPSVVEVFIAPPRNLLAVHRGRVPGSARKAAAATRQWAVPAIKLDKARKGADFCDATDVVIGIVDSGLDVKHPDIAGSGVTYHPRSKRSKDRSGHGTHVTGIVAAVPATAAGMQGVCQPTLRVYQIGRAHV